MSVFALRRCLAAACCSLVCVLMPSTASASSRHNRLEANVVRAMNSVRASYRLPALRSSYGLARAADAHSASMLRRNVMTHGAFASRVRRYVRARQVGENLAWMSRCDANAIVRMWLNSPAHRRVLLTRSFTRVGVGQRSTSRACFVTADFSSRR
jgi:uncharacterized protein YkwD